ncbi:cytochrome P450, partial [Streptomyces sp. IBSBF 2806]|uniref:cytochrome P450 n=1 Tax=Streptomyces sp. IBSBF 2806 TaxID=2903529 RepID=UPI002FDC41BB
FTPSGDDTAPNTAAAASGGESGDADAGGEGSHADGGGESSDADEGGEGGESGARGAARRRDRYDYFPFGGGARKCIGMDLALLELRLAVAMVVQRYRLELVPGHPVGPAALVSLRPQPGVLMHIRPADRNESPA